MPSTAEEHGAALIFRVSSAASGKRYSNNTSPRLGRVVVATADRTVREVNFNAPSRYFRRRCREAISDDDVHGRGHRSDLDVPTSSVLRGPQELMVSFTRACPSSTPRRSRANRRGAIDVVVGWTNVLAIRAELDEHLGRALGVRASGRRAPWRVTGVRNRCRDARRTTPGSSHPCAGAPSHVAPCCRPTPSPGLASRTSSAARTKEESFFFRTLAAGVVVHGDDLAAGTDSVRGDHLVHRYADQG